MSYRLLILLFAILFLSNSCSNDEVIPNKNDDSLVSSELVSTQTATNLQFILGISQFNLNASVFQYDVDIYKITYNTQYKNETIIASGLVLLPKTTDEVSMVSFQHGTITANKDAPTMLTLGNASLLLFAGIASPGFIGVIPDFIGFGSSADIVHPYFVESLTASSVIDNIKAAKELAIEKGNNFNDELFLAGYSEGGYATMATHKYIEENQLGDFKLIASFPAAGAYDVKAMQEYFFELDTYENPLYMAYVVHAYKITFDFSQPYSEFFKEPYASRIPSLFDGTMTSSQINGQLTTSIGELVDPDIRSNIDTSSDHVYIRDAFIENSLVNWAPSTKMYMYHGDADMTVPYENSLITYNKLIDNGGSPDVVKFITIQGANHSTGFIPYFEDFIPKMLSLK